MITLKRTMAVFAGVAAAGAALGGLVVGGIAAAISVVRYGFLLLPSHAEYYLAAVVVGAGFGALLAIAAGFGPLRQAPLGRLAGWTTVGTALGVASGFVTGGTGPILLGIVGFFAGALHVERQEWVAGRLPGASPTVDAPMRITGQ